MNDDEVTAIIKTINETMSKNVKKSYNPLLAIDVIN